MLQVLARKQRLFQLLNQRSLHTTQWKKHFSATKAPQDVSFKTARIWRPASLRYRCMCLSDPSAASKWKTVYEGPLSKAVKRVKRLSLTSATLSFVCPPLMILFGKQVASLPLVTLFLYSFGGGSLLLYHYCTFRYVHKMDFNPEEKLFAVETLSLFALRKRNEFSVDDITVYVEDRAFSTFEANGVKYFIHKELVESQQFLHFVEKWKKGEETNFKTPS